MRYLKRTDFDASVLIFLLGQSTYGIDNYDYIRDTMLDYDFKKAEPVASRRTHLLGLKMAVGDITLKEALCAAYFQGQYDMIKAL